jgi:membrane protease YdiL (CAAX protease family)
MDDSSSQIPALQNARIEPSVRGYNTWRRRVVRVVVSFLFVVAIFASIVLLTPALGQWKERMLAKLSLFLCGILPPLWFWCEYCFIWWTATDGHRPPFEQFKYGHEVGRNLWLAFVGVLLALYFK